MNNCTVCRQDRANVEETVVGLMCTDCLAKIRKTCVNRAERAINTMSRTLHPIDSRLYYKVRRGDFVTVVDARDLADNQSTVYDESISRYQPWYYAPYSRALGQAYHEEDGIQQLSYAEYAHWLQRSTT